MVDREEGDLRVKGLCAVTRALGLQHLKSMGACLAYNKKVPAGKRVEPRPGGPSKARPGTRVPPYVSNAPEVSSWALPPGADGFCPSPPGAVKRYYRSLVFPYEIHFVWGFCMGAHGA